MKFPRSSRSAQNAERVVDFPRLDGGLNLWELDYRLGPDQSPEMRNLWWQDGVLQCRDGQSCVCGPELDDDGNPVGEWVSPGIGWACAEELFWDRAFLHVGDKLCWTDPAEQPMELTVLCSGVPENRGAFFRYNEGLFYKNRGGFYRITYEAEAETPFTACDIKENAYTPVILLNGDPGTGSGDPYQPENRLSPRKTVRYNAAEETKTVSRTADGTVRIFSLGYTAEDQLTGVTQVYFGATAVADTLYTVDLEKGTVTFTDPPLRDLVVTFLVTIGVTIYRLPVGEVEAVETVTVDGERLTEGADYAVDTGAGRVVFVKAPPVHEPAANNTVEITYRKENPEAEEAIMSCSCAAVYGGDRSVCVVLGGCEAQPNAFFWNGNDDAAMNPGYWPMGFYQLAGDAEDGITGFGRQYSTLMVFKERSIGKAVWGVEEVEGRNAISLTYTPVNSRIGCDLPYTIQLVENNLVFCNTSSGVHMIRDTSAALENAVECVSRNINGTEQRPGLLETVRKGERAAVCSLDDGNRYWVCAGGEVFLWDYLVSGWKEPSWFYFTNVPARAFFRTVDKTFHLDGEGRITRFDRTFTDYNRAIEKVYQFPPQFFGTYDRLKDILCCVFTVRSDTDSEAEILYQSDYETRRDLTPIRSMSHHLTPRNLAYRYLGVQKFAHVARRTPECRHVRHFSMRLTNHQRAQDLAILSAQIYFRYAGRDR